MNPLLKIENKIDGLEKKIMNPLLKATKKVDEIIPWKTIGKLQGTWLGGKALFDAYAPDSWKNKPQIFYIEYSKKTNIEPIKSNIPQTYVQVNQDLMSYAYGTEQKQKIYFDAVFKVEHLSAREVASHPVQSGANISDHSYKIPATLTMDIGVSDVMANFNPLNVVLANSESRSVNAFTGMPITVYTRLKKYENMVLTKVRAMEDYKTRYELRAQIDFQQIIIAEGTGKSKVSLDSNVTKQMTQVTNKTTEINTDSLTGLGTAKEGGKALFNVFSKVFKRL
jgi:hypothetical protein